LFLNCTPRDIALSRIAATHWGKSTQASSESTERRPSSQSQIVIPRKKVSQRIGRSLRNESTTDSPSKTRKRAGPSVLEDPHRRPRQATPTLDVTFQRKDIVPFFRQSTPIPKTFHQPTEIYDVFCDRCPNDDPGAMWLLTRLFFAIGSPTAFEQLRETCIFLRERQGLPSLQSTADLRQTLYALDRLDVHASVASVLRRIYLVSLKSHCKNLELQHQESVPPRTRNATKRPRTEETGAQLEHSSAYGRADTRALLERTVRYRSEL
jgi:hypothetical protein